MARGGSILAGLFCIGACYSPNPQAGSPCLNDICPSGLVCSPATKTCEETAVLIDAPPPIDGLPAGCHGSGLITVCPDDPITGQTSIQITTTQTLNTATATTCLPYHLPGDKPDSSYCLIAAKTVSILAGGRINVTGTRPLVVLATNTLTIDGILDGASHRGGLSGPSSDPAACVPGGTPTLLDGGPGGSFGTAGGVGGGTDLGPKVAAAAATTTVTQLRGGCPGRAGNGANGGAAGRGGGALYLIADGSIVVAGTINASGASGTGAGLSAGGGGGGSGGMIVFDAPSVTMLNAAKVFANGGGGGEGGGSANGGNSGTDSSAPGVVGVGGAGNAGAGGDAGDGATGTAPGKPGENGVDSGGGGGGGVGVIRVFPSQSLGGSISPPPT